MPKPDTELAAALKKAADEIDRLLREREKMRQAHTQKIEKILLEEFKDLDPGLRDSVTRLLEPHIFNPFPPEPLKPPVRKRR